MGLSLERDREGAEGGGGGRGGGMEFERQKANHNGHYGKGVYSTLRYYTITCRATIDISYVQCLRRRWHFLVRRRR